MVPFVRQLGAESGVQLNPLVDGSEIPSTGNADQVFGIMMRATRGRIDRPFLVDRGNVFKKLGKGEPVRLNSLNEAWVSVVEALNNGAYEAVVQRLTTSEAKIKYAVVRRTADVTPREPAEENKAANVYPAILSDRKEADKVTDLVQDYWAYAEKDGDDIVRVTLYGKGLKEHTNAEQKSGYWVGFAVVAPNEATKVSINGAEAIDLEKNVHDKSSGLALYWDKAQKDQVSIRLEFFKQTVSLGSPITYFGDSRKVYKDGDSIPEFDFSVEDEIPQDKFLFAVKHLECFNDGIKLSFHADEKTENGVEVPNEVITLRVTDPEDVQLYEFTGSLVEGAKDDYGVSYYLPDVITARTDNLELTVGVQGTDAAIGTESEAYAYTENGQQAWVESDTLVCFKEGSTAYTVQDYMRCREELQSTEHDFAFISSGGSQAPALLAQLAQLAFDTNKILKFNVSGTLDVEAAIAFVNQLNMGANKTAHLIHAFWSPIKSDDPTGVNPKGYFETATLNIAYACGRNARKNAKGFAPKNYVVAGREWPIGRTGITQTVKISDNDLDKLAKAKINPVCWEVYTGGGRYVYRDSVTCALVDNSQRKLISVSEMSADIDDRVTRAAKDYLQLPMDKCVKLLSDYLKSLFEGAQASRWIVASNDPQMGGAAFKYAVAPNEARPYDAVDVLYWVRYDGTARAIFVTQTLTR